MGDFVFNAFVLIEEIGCRIENSVKFSNWLRPNGRHLYASSARLLCGLIYLDFNCSEKGVKSWRMAGSSIKEILKSEVFEFKVFKNEKAISISI